MLKFATEIGMKGLGYVKCDDEFNLAGPIAKFLPDAEKAELIKHSGLQRRRRAVLYFRQARDRCDAGGPDPHGAGKPYGADQRRAVQVLLYRGLPDV